MADNNILLNRLIANLYDGPLPAKQLRQLMGSISPATLSRLTRLAGTKITCFGQARASMYARPRDLRGIGQQIQVYRIDEQGNVHTIGTLHTLCGGYWWEGNCWKQGYYASLPWFIYDIKPDGFVGRAFAQRFSLELGLSSRLAAWRDDDILVALARRGEDTVGDIIVGEESLSRYMASARLKAAVSVPDDFPRLAEEAISGDPAGSSAGGEQPKFTVLTMHGDVPTRVLVKFSPLLSTPTGQRWSDLLVCEHIALSIVAEMGIAAAFSVLHQVGNRMFLEVDRFDRCGVLGRKPLHSLTVVDAEFIGVGTNWTAAAQKLLSTKLLTPEDAANLITLDLFGALLGNTDRHHGNISLIPDNGKGCRFRLAPVYDMLPMYYRPRDGEQLPNEIYHPNSVISLAKVYEYAIKFWLQAANDIMISEPFRKLCLENLDLLLKIGEGPKIINLKKSI